MKERLKFVMDIGEQMLICGAEVHRVEDSVIRMCKAFGANRVDVFIITSSMVLTVYNENEESYTQTRRITGTGTDIEKLHLLNSLSRRICEEDLTEEEIKKEYLNILKSKAYPLWLEVLSSAVIAGSFTLFFGGNLTQAVVSVFIGALIRVVSFAEDKAMMNKIFGKFVCSFVATALAFTAVKIGIISDVDKVIIGNIMTLIPGIGLTNAIRDLFVGDSIAGLLRLIEAVLTALAIGAGYFLLVAVWGGGLL